MNQEEKIRELEEKERALMVQSIEGARAGAVSPSIHQELKAIRRELSTLKRTITRAKNRTGQENFAAGAAVHVTQETRNRLQALAASRGMTLSQYLRKIIDEHLAAQAIDFSSGLKPLINRGIVEEQP